MSWNQAECIQSSVSAVAGIAIMPDDTVQLFEVIESAIGTDSLHSLVLSQPSNRQDGSASRIDIRPVRLQNQNMFQWTRQVGPQVFHDNQDPQATLETLRQAIGTDFRHIHLLAQDGRWSARFSRRGKCRLARDTSQGRSVQAPVLTDHNRQRQYLIPEGRAVPFLIETGIMTPEGKVRSRHFHKFRQINRYVEFIADIIDRLPRKDVIHVVDFGCGKSYLTFAAHYYLTRVAGRRVAITGLDRRSDVVHTCQEITEKLNLRGLQFQTGDIADYQPAEHVHLAVSLHACDTATDDAIAQAVQWQSDVILAVPCCQHELHAATQPDDIPLLSQHGILQERFCALATDAIRAALLEQAGYQTQVVEFIDMEHTAKNLLIRAVRRRPSQDNPGLDSVVRQMDRFCSVFHTAPLHLQRRLEELGILRSQNHSPSE